LTIPINIPFVGREEISVVTSILKNGALTSSANQDKVSTKNIEFIAKTVSEIL
jgi:perosamine synthetase